MTTWTQETGPIPTPTMEFQIKCSKWLKAQGARNLAVRICYDSQKWIRKYGGEVQRIEGYQKLGRIIKYLNDINNDPIPTE